MLKEARETKSISETEEQQEAVIEEKRTNGKEQVDINEGEKSEEEKSNEERVWTSSDIDANTMDTHNVAENSQNMDMTNEIEGEGELEEQKKDKDLGRLVRRRPLKVKPNLESSRKRFVRKEVKKNVNRFDVLRNLEEDEG